MTTAGQSLATDPMHRRASPADAPAASPPRLIGSAREKANRPGICWWPWLNRAQVTQRRRSPAHRADVSAARRSRSPTPGGDAAQRSCRLAGLLPRVRRTSVRDSSQTDGQLSHQAEAASGVAGAASRCRRGGRQTPGWTTCDSAARWPTSSVPPAIRHVLARGNGTSKRPARTPSGESERPQGYRALCCCGTISALS